jgi:vacuolar-type H+-ATPase subunit I/STV1
MPKKPIDYSNTCFYKLVCKDLDVKEFYIGHTTNFLKRKSSHKSDCTNENAKGYNIYVYQYIREHGNWCNWDMIIIERKSCTDRYDAEKHERQLIEQLQASLNKNVPSRTNNEYYEDNKTKILEYKKQYREKNKEQLSEKKKEYYKHNKEKFSEYREQYYEKNKERLTQKVTCECGSVVSRINLSTHNKTEKHQKWLEQQQQQE